MAIIPGIYGIYSEQYCNKYGIQNQDSERMNMGTPTRVPMHVYVYSSTPQLALVLYVNGFLPNTCVVHVNKQNNLRSLQTGKCCPEDKQTEKQIIQSHQPALLLIEVMYVES